MATTSKDIAPRAIAASPGQVNQGKAVLPPSPESLPLDTCGSCEHAYFGAFQGAAVDDESVWKSPDRIRQEASGEERPKRFRCRYCKRVIEVADNPQVTKI